MRMDLIYTNIDMDAQNIEMELFMVKIYKSLVESLNKIQIKKHSPELLHCVTLTL